MGCAGPSAEPCGVDTDDRANNAHARIERNARLPSPMPDASLLEAFPTPTDTPFVVEHIAEEFTSLCPKTGHPDFGVVTVRFEPRGPTDGGTCVELKSLKIYLQSFRTEGIFYEAVTNRIRDDLATLMKPAWLVVRTDWRGRGGIRSVVRAASGAVPERYAL